MQVCPKTIHDMRAQPASFTGYSWSAAMPSPYPQQQPLHQNGGGWFAPALPPPPAELAIDGRFMQDPSMAIPAAPDGFAVLDAPAAFPAQLPYAPTAYKNSSSLPFNVPQPYPTVSAVPSWAEMPQHHGGTDRAAWLQTPHAQPVATGQPRLTAMAADTSGNARRRRPNAGASTTSGGGNAGLVTATTNTTALRTIDEDFNFLTTDGGTDASPRFHGTAGRSTRCRQPQRQVIAAIIDNKAGDVGVATCCLHSFAVTLTQFNDSPSFSKAVEFLHNVQPIELLLPSTASTGRLATTLADSFDDVCTVSSLQRRLFNDVRGGQRLAELMANDAAMDVIQDSDKYLCLAAAGAVLSYLETSRHCVFVPRTLRVTYAALSQYVEMQRQAYSALHLLSPFEGSSWGGKKAMEVASSAESGGSTAAATTLVDALDSTKTAMGRRLLRANLLQPLSDAATIALRLDTVGLLVGPAAGLHQKLQAPLSSIGCVDLDQALAHFSRDPATRTLRTATTTIAALMATKKALTGTIAVQEVLQAYLDDVEHSVVPNATTLLADVQSTLSVAKAAALIDEIVALLDVEVIDMGGDAKQSATSLHLQQCFAVRSGTSSLLDLARRRYSDTIEKMFALADTLREVHNIPSLRLTRDGRRGYFLTLDTKAISHCGLDPNVFIHVVATANRATASTKELLLLCREHRDAEAEVIQTQDGIVAALVVSIRGHMARLHAVSECVAVLDLLVSHATFTMRQAEAARPVMFNPAAPQGAALHVVNGRHCAMRGRGVPHTLRLSEEHMPPADGSDANAAVPDDHPTICILTGPNASGKSTVLREVGHWCVLAHIGCYIPCRSATLPLLDRMCVRMSSDDEHDASKSSFQHEMRDLSSLIRSVTRRSLVIIDELGRSTSSAEGSAIAIAATEFLADVRCTAIIATHFVDVPLIADRFNNRVVNRHLHATASGASKALVFDYALADGPCAVEHYGVTLARMVGFPDAIMNRVPENLAVLAAPRQQSNVMDSEVVAGRAEVRCELRTAVAAFFAGRPIDDVHGDRDLSDISEAAFFAMVRRLKLRHGVPVDAEDAAGDIALRATSHSAARDAHLSVSNSVVAMQPIDSDDESTLPPSPTDLLSGTQHLPLHASSRARPTAIVASWRPPSSGAVPARASSAAMPLLAVVLGAVSSTSSSCTSLDAICNAAELELD
jgi:DNA mismatch repair protein MSH4